MPRFNSAILILLAIAILGCNKSQPVSKSPKRATQTASGQAASSAPTSATNAVGNDSAQRSKHLDQPSTPLDTRFITDDCFAALVVNPHRAFTSPALAGLPLDKVLRGPNERLGVPLDQVDQLIILLAPMADGDIPDAPFAPLTIVRFHVAVEPENIGRVMYGEFETSSRGGRTFLRQAAPPHMTACFYNEKTMLVSTAPRVEQMLAAANATTPLTERLQSAGSQYDLLAVLIVEPIRPSLAPLREHLRPQLPAFIVPLFDVAEHAKSAAVRADLRGPVLLALDVDPIDDSARTKVEEHLRNIDQTIRFMFSAIQAQAARQPSDPTMQSLMELAGEIVTGLTIGRAQDRVTLTFPRPASFDRLGEHLRAAIEAGETARNAHERSRRFRRRSSNNEREILSAARELFLASTLIFSSCSPRTPKIVAMQIHFARSVFANSP